MDTSKPLLSGVAATIVGTIGTVLAATSVALPAPWAFVVMLIGFVCATLSGFSARPPQVVEGSPKLQGAALVIATTLGGVLSQVYAIIPTGWPQSLALAGGALLGWLTGHAMPQLGSGATLKPAQAEFVPFVPPSGGAHGAADLINQTWPPSRAG